MSSADLCGTILSFVSEPLKITESSVPTCPAPALVPPST